MMIVIYCTRVMLYRTVYAATRCPFIMIRYCVKTVTNIIEILLPPHSASLSIQAIIAHVPFIR